MDITAQVLKQNLRAVRGRLLMVDFNENNDGYYTCHVHLPDGTVVYGTFDDDLAAIMEKSLRHEVYAMGVATIDAASGQLITLHIGELILIEPDAVAEAELQHAYDRYFADHDTATHLRQALHEAISGQTYPISDLWQMVDSDDED